VKGIQNSPHVVGYNVFYRTLFANGPHFGPQWCRMPVENIGHCETDAHALSFDQGHARVHI
jgi:hypothetical protein